MRAGYDCLVVSESLWAQA